ncbi:MAG: hypothetical protein R2815_11565 [Flavobacteriales bacterium]
MQQAAGMIDKVQRRLFLTREYEAIRGKGGYVFWMLYAIMLVALAAVAIGRTGLEHLQGRMDDPFTTWVDIPASNTTVGDHYDELRAYLNDCARTGRFHARSTSGSYAFSVQGLVVGEEPYWDYLRLQSFGFHADSALLRAVLGEGNLITELVDTDALSSPTAYKDGIIITANALKELGYDLQDLREKKIILRNSMYHVPVRVLAVVQAVPGRRDVFMEHHLLKGIQEAEERKFLSTTVDTTHVLLGFANQGEARAAASTIGQLFGVGPQAVDVVPDTSTLTHAWRVRCVGCGLPLLTERSIAQGQLAIHRELKGFMPVVLHEVNYRTSDPSDSHGETLDSWFDHLTITFSDLDSIASFQRDLVDKFKVELDLDRVRSMENFGFIAGLSRFLVAALVLFAVLSILLFLYNLLQNHLERIKMNLGTFMAFGLPEHFLYRGYLRIIGKLLLRAMLAAMATLAILQALVWLVQRMGVQLPDLIATLSVIGNPWLYVTLLALSLAGFIIFRWQLRRFLASTPGDLIYARR